MPQDWQNCRCWQRTLLDSGCVKLQLGVLARGAYPRISEMSPRLILPQNTF